MVLRLLQWLYPPTRPSPVFPTATLPFWTPWFTYLFLPETLAMWFQAKKFSPSDWLLCLQWALSITACSRCLLNLQFCQMLLEAGETIIHVLKELKKPKKTNKNYKHKTHHPPLLFAIFPLGHLFCLLHRAFLFYLLCYSPRLFSPHSTSRGAYPTL